MRGVATAVLALSGCGRVWFDPRADAQPDAPPECSPANLVDTPYGNSSEGADGTAAAPFLICSEAQLAQIAQHPEHWASAFHLGADLDLSAPFTPIATKTQPFTGDFDGHSHALRGLAIDQPTADAIGMFAFTGDGAHLHDLTLANVDLKAHNDVGALAGNAFGTTIERITMSGMITSGGAGVGGVVGYASGVTPNFIPTTFSDIDVTVTLEADFGNAGGVSGILGGIDGKISNAKVAGSITGGNSMGGIVGTWGGEVDNCVSSATVNGSNSLGGLVGAGNYQHAVIRNSSASGDVTGFSVCGGLAADDATLISHCSATGNVNCGYGECAGLAAQPNGDIEYSFATGDVTNPTSDLVAGLVAAPNSPATIRDCYATGHVTGRDQVSGLVAAIVGNTTITRSYATGRVDGRDQVGGLVGYSFTNSNPVVITDSFMTGDVNGTSATNMVSFTVGDPGGTGSYTMTNLYASSAATCTNTTGACGLPGLPADPTTFQSSAMPPLTSWDFTIVWKEVPGGYPVLR